MKYFFPDSQDLVDPSFDFESETRAEFRVRQRDDLYAHEVMDIPPFDGILVSKTIVDGSRVSSGKYTIAQRHRLFRLGIREFLRADNHQGPNPLEIMGDCGAFNYKDEEEPPFSVEEVVQFYEDIGFDIGISVDHVILNFNNKWDALLPGIDPVPREIIQRQELTLSLADEFLHLSKRQGARFLPIGVAQGWSPLSYADAVDQLQKMGYDYIALGGMVPLRTPEILESLSAVNDVRKASTKLHLLGVTRVGKLERFKAMGVVSFDSTSPFLQAFKDAKDNYHTLNRAYSAVRVPQVESSPKIARLIRAGAVDHDTARELERLCLQRIRGYDRGDVLLDDVLEPLRDYELLHSKGARLDLYREVLQDRPWKECKCEICKSIGVDVLIFRGAERNKRRGFHNLTIFRQKLSAQASMHCLGAD